MEREELPIIFAMELARHPDTLSGLSGLSSQEQDKIISGAREILTRDEMKNYVESLSFR